MGTQQILLIVVGVIAVAIAIIIGMTVFNRGGREANRDAISEDLLRLGATAQAYFHRPRSTGGGGESFTGIQLRDMGVRQIEAAYEGADSYAENANARFVIRSVDDASCVLEGLSRLESGTDGKPATVRATIREGDVQIDMMNWD